MGVVFLFFLLTMGVHIVYCMSTRLTEHVPRSFSGFRVIEQRRALGK